MGVDGPFDEILSRASEGDPTAFADLYRAYAPGVLGYLRAQGASDAEDLMGEVFVSVARRIASFEGDERKFRSWIFTVAHSRLIDDRRHRARRPEQPVDPSALPEASAVGDVEEEALASLGERWALELIAGLSPDQRAVLLLRVLADLSVDEVARILQKRPGAVKTLLRRALHTARSRLPTREGVS